MPVEAKQHHAINDPSSEHAQMFHYQRRRELAFHHMGRSLFIKHRAAWSEPRVFDGRIKSDDDNSDHFIALSHTSRGRAGGNVLIHHRFDLRSRYVRLRRFHC